MSRFRTRWLDEGDEPEEPEPPAPIARDETPWVPIAPAPAATRGMWLPDDPEDLPPDPADQDAPRQKVYPVPKWTGFVQGLGGLMLAVLVFLALLGNMNIGKALIVLPVLVLITHAVAQRLAIVDKQPAIVSIVMAGLVVKFLGVLARYWIGLQVYGRSDATEYVLWGKRIAPGLRHFEVMDIGRLRGTNFIRLITGIVFAITPASEMVGFFVFGFMSFVGVLFFWRAFKRAFPNTNDLKYLQILVLLPSLAFWPSSIGKDAWMVLGTGIASYGVACILTNRTVVGWVSFIAGMYAVLMVRPHVGIALMGGLVIAEVFRTRGSQGAARAGLSIILIVFFGGIVMSSAAAFLGIENWNKASVNQELEDVGDRTGQGGSQFTPTPVNSPVQFPLGAFTVLMRPMPYEAGSPQEMLSAFENVAILVILILSAPRLWNALRHSRRRPYVLYCLGAIIIFVVEYSSFSNFALIARQRTTITALFLVFLCLPQKPPTEVENPNVRNRPRGSIPVPGET
jgi:hypothetical protein